jgi:hypothetical protein
MPDVAYFAYAIASIAHNGDYVKCSVLGQVVHLNQFGP